MTLAPAQLQDAVRLDGNRLNLALDTLGSRYLTGRLGAFLPAGRLVLRDVTARTLTAQGVTVTGTGEDGPFKGLAVTAEFTAGAAGVTAQVTATGTAPWSFVTAFPRLAGTLWEEARFSRPELRFDGGAPEPTLTFSGTLDVTTRMAALDLLFQGVEHRLTGDVTLLRQPAEVKVPMTTVPSILLNGPEAAELRIGALRLTERRYDLLALPRFRQTTADFDVTGRLIMSASVPFTVGGVAKEMYLYAELADWSGGVVLRGRFRRSGAVSLSDVLTLTGLPEGTLKVPFFDITKAVVLTDVSASVTPERGIGHFALKVETAEAWHISDRFKVQAIDVVFRVENPADSATRRLSGVVSGLVAFGEHGTLELAADFGERGVSATLRGDDGPLKIGEVYHDLTGKDSTDFPDLRVTGFELFGALPHEQRPFTFSAALDLEGTWAILPRVTLTGVGFAVNYGSATSFIASATLVVAKVPVSVSAGYTAGTKGWHFTGNTAPDARITLGRFIDDLARDYAGLTTPAPIKELTVENLGVDVSTGEGRLFLQGKTLMKIDGKEIALAVAIDTKAVSVRGQLTVAVEDENLSFAVYFARKAETTRFAAVYSHQGTAPTPSVKALVGALSPSAAADIDKSIKVGLRQALFTADRGTYLFGIDLTATIDLAGLPVVGPRLTDGKRIMGFDPLRILAASAPIIKEQVEQVNDMLPDGAAKLPAQDLPAGFTLGGTLKLGPLEAPVTLPTTPGEQAQPTVKETQTGDNVIWRKVQADYGPVHVERIGVSYLRKAGEPARLAVLVDAAVKAGGLTLSCTGLSAGLTLEEPGAKPTFALQGLGLSYSGGPARISGAFLAGKVLYKNVERDAYSGKVVIGAGTFTISAVGSYIQLEEGQSLFVHAYLDYPIGGPPFFFVCGLAAAFGYNRRLIAPPVERVAEFPLVAEATGTKPPGELTEELRKLEEHIQVSPGDHFLAFGVRFTSFQMIDTFVLVTAGFGHKFEVNVLGVATIVLPARNRKTPAGKKPTPIAELQLMLKATFAPADGYFELRAQLAPNSYLLDPACRLTGGFAFVTWFGKQNHGDFVLTAGGYHPRFNKPSHYPAVPRLGFNWRQSPRLTLKGSAYFALTPGALMAGGSLDIIWDDGALRAWFSASLDFLMAWQPYHYEAALHVNVGATYTISKFGFSYPIRVDVSTDVRIWGPEFSGEARIKAGFMSIDIGFGPTEHARPSPLDWDAFRATQLPDKDVVTIALRGGAPNSGSGTDLGVVNPLTLCLVTDAAMPSSIGRAGSTTLPGTGAAFGVAPMDRRDVVSTHEITILRDGVAAETHFRYAPVGKDLPAALWGDELTPSLKKPALVKNVLTGYEITPLPPEEPATSAGLPLTALTSGAATPKQGAFSWRTQRPFQAAAQPAIDLSGTQEVRTAIAGKVLRGADLDLRGFTGEHFLETPEVAARV
ncbi:DUF6603 domain-containing protein [Nonomuraea jabiensis]|uniref:DUF6603 domain-containing protein n=1 Tax=Nonomuraea jabiensis TaxID=882448 RepID=UPI00342BB4D8